MISAFSSFIDHPELSKECRFFSSQLLEVLECTANKRFSKTNLPVLASGLQQDEMLLCRLCSLFVYQLLFTCRWLHARGLFRTGLR